jgi:hypothetical protein
VTWRRPSWMRRSAAHPAAVDGDNGASNIIACGATKEESGAGKVVWLSPAPGGDALKNLAVTGLASVWSASVLAWRSNPERWH